jgi:hypothetical protein
VLPGGFAQAVTTTTTTIVAAPITVGSPITSNAVTNNTVNNNTVNNVAGLMPPLVPVVPTFAAGVDTGVDICVNLPGSQLSAPAGLVLTFARNGSLVCVTPANARLLNPRAVSVKVPVGAKLVFANRSGLLCVGKGSATKKLTVPSTMTASKVMALAKSGKLVCLKP